VNASAPGRTPASIRFGPQEVLGRDFEFDGSEASLRVTLSAPRPPEFQLTGKITRAGGEAVAGTDLIFMPFGAVYATCPIGACRFGATDQNGVFHIPESAGVYRVYLVGDPAEAAWKMADPQFIKAQEAAIPPVTVAAGGNPEIRIVVPEK
jgi:hypothetical protein